MKNEPNSHSSYLSAYEDGTDRVSRNVGIQNSDAGELQHSVHGGSLKSRIGAEAVITYFKSAAWSFPGGGVGENPGTGITYS